MRETDAAFFMQCNPGSIPRPLSSRVAKIRDFFEGGMTMKKVYASLEDGCTFKKIDGAERVYDADLFLRGLSDPDFTPCYAVLSAAQIKTLVDTYGVRG